MVVILTAFCGLNIYKARKKTCESAFDDAKHLKTLFFDDFTGQISLQPNGHMREQLLNNEHQTKLGG